MDRQDELNLEILRLWEKYTIGEMFGAIYHVTGVNKSQKQIDFAIRRDHELQMMEAAWEKWLKENPVHYTSDDFPQYVKDTMTDNGISDPNEMVKWLYNKYLKKQLSMLGNFFEYRGRMYFNAYGYRWIISNALRHDMVTPDDYPDWQTQSGLFPYIQDFHFGT